MKATPRLATRLLAMMLLVIAIGAATLVVTALVIAPKLFADLLAQTGADDPTLTSHALNAFETAFAWSVCVAVLLAVAGAIGASWVFSRRVAGTIGELALAAQHFASGDFSIPIPSGSFGRELQELSTSFTQMARTLAHTDMARASLLADLAHEIRTPLATLQAYVDGLDDGILEPSPQTYAVMRGQIARIDRLGTDLRDAADVQEDALALAPEVCDLAEVVSESVAAELPLYDAVGVQLRVSGSTPLFVRGDRQRLGQVVMNLLANAVRHTPTDGRVDVVLGTSDDQATVVITDTGEGIPADELEAIFDRFHRADSARCRQDGGGSGLGLTISRAIATAHGGTLVAFSDGPGRGSSFRLTLPIAGGSG